MDAKVGIGVKVIVSRGHLFWVEELGHLPPAGRAGQAGRMGAVCGAGGPCRRLDGGHRPGQRAGLGRPGLDDADRLLWRRRRLWLLQDGDREKGNREGRYDERREQEKKEERFKTTNALKRTSEQTEAAKQQNK